MTQSEFSFALERLINTSRTAEGQIMPLPLLSGVRVPTAYNLRIRSSYGNKYTLMWTEPEPVGLVSHYIVTVRRNATRTIITENSFITNRSPVEVIVNESESRIVTFTVQTVLNNGQISLLEDSPSVSATFKRGGGEVVEGGNVVSYAPQVPVTVNFICGTNGNVFSTSNPGRIIGIGLRTSTGVSGGGVNGFDLNIQIDGAAITSTTLTNGNFTWLNSILSLPGNGDMQTPGHWRFYPLHTAYEVSALVSISSTTSAITPPAIDVTVFYENKIV